MHADTTCTRHTHAHRHTQTQAQTPQTQTQTQTHYNYNYTHTHIHTHTHTHTPRRAHVDATASHERVANPFQDTAYEQEIGLPWRGPRLPASSRLGERGG